jgi:hypothetical protein
LNESCHNYKTNPITEWEDDWDIIVRPRRSATRENIIALAKADRKDFRYQTRSFDFKYFKSIINVIALIFPSIL